MTNRSVRRLALSFLRHDPGRTFRLAAIIAVSVFAAGFLRSGGQAIIDQFNSTSEFLHGAAVIRLAGAASGGDGAARGGDGALVGSGSWISSETRARISENLEPEQVEIRPRYRFDAFLSSVPNANSIPNSPVTVFTVPDLADRPRKAGIGGTELPGQPKQIELVVPYVAPSTDTGFARVSVVASVIRAGSGRMSVVASSESVEAELQAAGLVPGGSVGTELVVVAESSRSPSEIAFNVRELLSRSYPDLHVVSRNDMTGLTVLYSARNLPAAFTLLVALLALTGVVGATLIGIESRKFEFIVLHSHGYPLSSLRRLLGFEIAATAAVGSTVGVLAWGILTAVAANLSTSLSGAIWMLFIGIVVPPASGFIALRKPLRKGVQNQLAEFRG